MQIRRIYLDQAEEACGIVIVIDVVRAFTVAAYAFAGGAQRLWLVHTVEEALALRDREPGALLAGEVGGRLISGFDFNNSPALMSVADVLGRLLIQRTGAGTQGAVRAINATHILVCSLANAQATALYAYRLAMETGEPVTLLPTASLNDLLATEDDFCADYLESLLLGGDDAADILAKGIAHLQESERFAVWEQDEPDFPSADIAKILDANRFGFAMVGTRKQWREITYVEVEGRVLRGDKV